MQVSSKQTLSCSCDQVRIVCYGQPTHLFSTLCFENWRRTGNLNGLSAVYASDAIEVQGQTVSFTRLMPSGEQCHYQFCPSCGVTVLWQTAFYANQVVIPSGLIPPDTFLNLDIQGISVSECAMNTPERPIHSPNIAITEQQANIIKPLH